ncbi:MAG: hypothetical protein LBR26_03220 [Prevotella sp.]|jgi:hypothetical protein|nr:hypothetical protein [Prevotella sp.]
MRNRELLEAIENYIADVKRAEKGDSENAKTFVKLSAIELKEEIKHATMEDITEIFADVRDYWDTLEVGK